MHNFTILFKILIFLKDMLDIRQVFVEKVTYSTIKYAMTYVVVIKVIQSHSIIFANAKQILKYALNCHLHTVQYNGINRFHHQATVDYYVLVGRLTI